MGFPEFLEKYKKPALVAGGLVALVAGALFLIPDDNDDEEQKKTQQQKQQQQQFLQQQQQQQQMQGGQHSSQMSPQEREKAVQETLQLKAALQRDIKISFNENGILPLQTLKMIYHRAVLLGLKRLIIFHDECIKQRQNYFKDLIKYFAVTQQLYDYYYKTLNQSLLTVVLLLEVPEDVMAHSKKYYEETKELKVNYLRDLTWHFMSEETSKKSMNKEDYKKYLQVQIDNIQPCLKEIQEHEQLGKVDKNVVKLLINGRVDDIAFFETGFSDTDAIKGLREHLSDPEVAELLKQRTKTIEECC